jgi:hypothetical protein
VLYIFGGVWVVVAIVLIVVCGGVFSECYGYEWQENEKKGGISLSFVSKNVVRGRKGGEDVLAARYGSVLRSMLLRERRLDFCCDVEMDVDLGPEHNGGFLWGCDFIYYASIEGVVVDIGGMVFRNVYESASSFLETFRSIDGWSYGLYVGVVMEDVIFRPSLYCVYRSYDEEVALEGRIKQQWSLLPLGLRDFMLGFSGEIGYDYTGKPYGLPYASSLGRRDYWYYGTALSLIYKLASGEASVGVAYEGNAAKKDSWVNWGENYKNNVWFNALLNFSF